MIVHLVDGTCELFLYFYGLRRFRAKGFASRGCRFCPYVSVTVYLFEIPAVGRRLAFGVRLKPQNVTRLAREGLADRRVKGFASRGLIVCPKRECDGVFHLKFSLLGADSRSACSASNRRMSPGWQESASQMAFR